MSTNLHHSLIIPRLYLSDLSSASDEPLLKTNNITHVISVIDFGQPTYSTEANIRTLHIPIEDTISTEITPHLPLCTEWITEALKDPNANVLVHCMMVRKGHRYIVQSSFLTFQAVSRV